MKFNCMFEKKLTFFLFLLILSGCFLPLWADEQAPEKPKPAVEFPPNTPRPFVAFSGGPTAAWVTRIIKKETSSNFVWKDFMAGVFFAVETKNMQPINSIIRLSLYYPISFTFRDVPQKPKNILRYAIDLFAGVLFEPKMWRYLNFNLAPGLHFLFQNSDKWNYINLGIGGMLGIEFPISRRWTLGINGFVSFDYGNLGTNFKMQPFNIVYQYQVDLSIRYSKKAVNPYPYIKSRTKI